MVLIGRMGFRRLRPESLSINPNWSPSPATSSNRAAVSVTVTGEETPVFGAVWFSARVATDIAERLVAFEEIKVSAVRFPTGEEADIDALTAILEEEVAKHDIVFPLDELLVSLEMVDMERELAAGFNDEAPELIVVNRPMVLAMIDGAARWQESENSQLRYVANTPLFS